MISPVTDRELRVALLRRGARTRWMVTIWNAAVLTFLIVLFSGFSPNRSSGRTLFFILFAVGCYSAVVEGIRLTSDLFAEERRNGTLGDFVLVPGGSQGRTRPRS